MVGPENMGLLEKVFADAWLQWSLKSDNPNQYLDHPDTKESKEYLYLPAHIVRGSSEWNIGNILIIGPDNQFALPANQIAGVFINIKASRLLIGIRDPETFWGEDNKEESDPFDRYSLQNHDFRIPFTSKMRGAPILVLDKSTISAIIAEN